MRLSALRQAVMLLASILSAESLVAADAGSRDVASTGPAFKNEQPCMDGLCIGDGLPEVAMIPWDPATVQVPFEAKQPVSTLVVTDKRRAEIEKIYRGDLRKALPYLAGSSFDRSAVPALRGLVACQHRGGLAGTFVGNDGNPTTVGLALLPDPQDPKVQRWTVTKFERQFVNAKTEQQLEAVRAEMDRRYAAAAGPDVKPRHGTYYMSGDRVYLTMQVGKEGYAALKQHPLCAAGN